MKHFLKVCLFTACFILFIILVAFLGVAFISWDLHILKDIFKVEGINMIDLRKSIVAFLILCFIVSAATYENK